MTDKKMEGVFINLQQHKSIFMLIDEDVVLSYVIRNYNILGKKIIIFFILFLIIDFC